MIGGLWKSTSTAALFAAAGLFVGGVAMPSAKAADLGGDCCADLEERVAELEATTARKGNRRMSLTVTGQVNKTIMYWNDGHNSNTYIGLDNTNSSSRFSFLGEARVSPSVKMGFDITIETEGSNTTSRATTVNEDGNFSGATYMAASLFNNGTANQGNSDSFFGDARRAAWWIDHKDVGKVTVGRYESAGVVTTIDLGGISVIASASTALLNGNLNLRTTDGAILASIWGQHLDPAAANGRSEVLRYDSPTLAGFVLSASIAESFREPYWGAMLRWAGEFSGFRLAAGIGYEHVEDRYHNATLATSGAIGGSPTAVNNGYIDGDPNSAYPRDKPDIDAWGFSLAGLHTPTGLFLQGQYMRAEFNNNGSNTTAYWGETCGAATSGGTNVQAGTACNPKADASFWQIQGGITKNWFGIGNTAIYGEYNRLNDWGAELGGRTFASSVAPNGSANLNGVTGTKATVIGLGLVQNIDAAATELYIGWRRFELDLDHVDAANSCTAGTPGGSIGNTGRVAGSTYRCRMEDLDVITAGARVKF